MSLEMVLIDLLDTELPQTFNFLKNIVSAIKRSTVKGVMPVNIFSEYVFLSSVY